MSNLSTHEAEKLAKTHYENFPVVSWFLPKKLRKPIALIYAFARTADDLADEGTDSPQQRIDALNLMAEALLEPSSSFYEDLLKECQRFALPVSLLNDLLIAFKQDVTQSRYEDFNEVLRYCSYSANPIGRLMLQLIGESHPERLLESDKICTSLQLINFWQDWYSDLTERDRIYIPRQYLAEENLQADTFWRDSEATQKVLTRLYRETQAIMDQGSNLGEELKGRFGFQIRLTVAGGNRILELCRARKNPQARPILRASDKLLLFFQAL